MKFKLRPEVSEAIQFTGENIEEMESFTSMPVEMITPNPIGKKSLLINDDLLIYQGEYLYKVGSDNCIYFATIGQELFEDFFEEI